MRNTSVALVELIMHEISTVCFEKSACLPSEESASFFFVSI